MKKEDFKNILPVHFESCRQFIENNNGECNYVLCKDCPFYEENEDNYKFYYSYIYNEFGIDCDSVSVCCQQYFNEKGLKKTIDELNYRKITINELKQTFKELGWL